MYSHKRLLKLNKFESNVYNYYWTVIAFCWSRFWRFWVCNSGTSKVSNLLAFHLLKHNLLFPYNKSHFWIIHILIYMSNMDDVIQMKVTVNSLIDHFKQQLREFRNSENVQIKSKSYTFRSILSLLIYINLK